ESTANRIADGVLVLVGDDGEEIFGAGDNIELLGAPRVQEIIKRLNGIRALGGIHRLPGCQNINVPQCSRDEIGCRRRQITHGPWVLPITVLGMLPLDVSTSDMNERPVLTYKVTSVNNGCTTVPGSGHCPITVPYGGGGSGPSGLNLLGAGIG